MSSEPLRAVLFSDLDGTFLDQHTYRPGVAVPALRELNDLGVLVVFCSAKTRTEMRHLQRELGMEAPFVVENGAAAFDADGLIACFGVAYETVLDGLALAATEVGVAVRSFGDMSLDEISESTGLSREEAARAKAREFSVTFMIEGESSDAHIRLGEALAARGLCLVRGALFYSAQGPHDKGTAVRYLIEHLQPRRTYATGDFANDLPMLEAVEVPMLVQRPDGEWADVPVDGLVRLEGVGPEGWVLGAKRLIDDLAA
ncbi:MAG TPA: mannosyl-3-phosphoglycerate phosphatase [Acidimicrobiia bacterium]|nr:mannosyl-3-phosphoglycerate phosphatase [Acidimicrobiia bacterium]